MTLVSEPTGEDASKSLEQDKSNSIEDEGQGVHLQAPTPRPNFSRRPSYDLFECIEQSKHKRLSENHARFFYRHLGGRPVAREVIQVAGRTVEQTALVWDPIETLLDATAVQSGS